MKSKDKEFINSIKYSENKMAKKILRDARISKWIFYSMFLLETITYILIVINMENVNGLIFYSIVYIIFAAYFSVRYAEYLRKSLRESMQNTICPKGFLNLNLYNAKKLISNQGAYNYALNNIAYAYIQLGDLNKANEIIEYVEKRKVNIVLKSAIIQNKMDISFYNNDVKKFNEEYKNLNSILKFLPRKYKKEALLNMNLKQAVINKNRNEVNHICDELEKKKQLLNKVIASYYRGLMLEEKNNKEYEEYYKFVAENGNNIMIANKAREKIKLEKSENIYKRKMHLGYKIFNLIILAMLLISTIFFGEYTIVKYFVV